MACALTRSGFDLTAKTGAAVTIKVVADNTQLTGAKYGDQDLAFQDNSTKFTVANGGKLLMLALAGPPEDVDIVEDCGGGQTQSLFSFQNQFQPVVGLNIIGN